MTMGSNETVALARDCVAVVIPAGERVTLEAGTTVTITQALGGSFTVWVAGNLFRIAGRDADALGKQPDYGPQLAEDASDSDVEGLVWEQMKTCFDPEIPINIVDLGLIYRCEVESIGPRRRRVRIIMTLTAPGCGMGDILVADVRDKVLQVPTVEDAEVEMTFDPPWSMHMMSEAGKLQTGMI